MLCSLCALHCVLERVRGNRAGGVDGGYVSVFLTMRTKRIRQTDQSTSYMRGRRRDAIKKVNFDKDEEHIRNKCHLLSSDRNFLFLLWHVFALLSDTIYHSVLFDILLATR